ncbi:MAG: SH3 domain-containing protein [Leptolyngbya sp. SIOISBB]|nr:SH3 domain-containing protein [Leptolyngbya sp. SIOISBB]
MVWMRWERGLCGSAIASCLWLTVACQSSPEATSSSEATTPPSEDVAETPEPTPETTPSEAAPTPAPPAPSNTAATAPAAATPTQSCSASAFIVDTDPAGLNVRGGPSSEFAVQDTLPTAAPVEVTIVGATNEWFLINEAWSEEQQELQRPGWVYAPLLGVSTTSLDINDPEAPTTLYAEPDGNAAVAAEIPKYSEVTLLGCTGNWLQVEAPETTGWLAAGEQCSNPVSTCP